MLVIDDNPRNVGMGRVKFFSGNSYVIHKFISLCSSRACIDHIPIHIVLGGTLLALSHKISSVLLQTNAERQTLTIVVEFFNSTSLNKITLALFHSVLASKCPTGTVLSSFSVAVGVEIEFAYLPEVRSGCSCLERSLDKL